MKSPAFQFYVRDWLCSPSVQRMTGEQVKAYLYLLCAAWLETPRATLPVEDMTLAALARIAPETWHKIKLPVLACFRLHEGRWINDRLMAVSTRSEINSANGAHGGNPNFRHGKRNPYYQRGHKRKDNRKD